MSVPSVDGRENASRNEVILAGRLGGSPVRRPLPSGDVLIAWRLIVERGERRLPGKRVVDTLACVTFRQDVGEEAETWRDGDIVEVRGSIRRRFWRAASGPVSRYEIEVMGARRLTNVVAPEQSASSAGGEGAKQ